MRATVLLFLLVAVNFQICLGADGCTSGDLDRLLRDMNPEIVKAVENRELPVQ